MVFLLWPGYYKKSDETTTEIILSIYTQEAQNMFKAIGSILKWLLSVAIVVFLWIIYVLWELVKRSD